VGNFEGAYVEKKLLLSFYKNIYYHLQIN